MTDRVDMLIDKSERNFAADKQRTDREGTEQQERERKKAKVDRC